MRLLAALLLVMLTLQGCGPEAAGGTREEAEQLAANWLEAVKAESPDRGWSLLHPSVREMEFGNDAAVYRSLAEAADWARFTWRLGDVSLRDGWYWVTVVFPGGREAVPKFLRDGGIVQFVDVQEASIPVRIEPLFGPKGI